MRLASHASYCCTLSISRNEPHRTDIDCISTSVLPHFYILLSLSICIEVGATKEGMQVFQLTLWFTLSQGGPQNIAQPFDKHLRLSELTNTRLQFRFLSTSSFFFHRRPRKRERESTLKFTCCDNISVMSLQWFFNYQHAYQADNGVYNKPS